MNSKIDELSTKVAVVHTEVNNLTKQLDRIEEKLNTK
jgi:tetrahydromethanopterin S-methyltransferase subunit G